MHGTERWKLPYQDSSMMPRSKSSFTWLVQILKQELVGAAVTETVSWPRDNVYYHSGSTSYHEPTSLYLHLLPGDTRERVAPGFLDSTSQSSVYGVALEERGFCIAGPCFEVYYYCYYYCTTVHVMHMQRASDGLSMYMDGML